MISAHNAYMPYEPAFGGEGHGDFWHYQIFDLFEYVDQTVLIRFDVSSDGMGAKRGWYVDDVMITDNWTSIEEPVETYLPEKLIINASPNPFNSAAEIRFTIPQGERFTGVVDILDAQGRYISCLKAENTTGTQSVTWQPDNLPSGVYLAMIRTEKRVGNTRLLYIK